MDVKTWAEQGAYFALQWIKLAENSIQGFEYCLANGVKTAPNYAMIAAAFNKHFQLVDALPVPTPNKKLVDSTYLQLIKKNYSGVKSVLKNPSKYFKYVTTATADASSKTSPAYTYGGMSGSINFNGDIFKNYDAKSGSGYGPLSRAAMVLHEAIHIVDTLSGPPNHIYEHDPAYDTQRADQAVHNASSYASFAQHVTYSKDTRYGAGAGKTKF